MGKHTPNTCEPSKSHTSEGHPQRHIDEYTYGSDGRKVSEEHGLSWSGKVMDAIDRFIGGGKNSNDW